MFLSEDCSNRPGVRMQDNGEWLSSVRMLVILEVLGLSSQYSKASLALLD